MEAEDKFDYLDQVLLGPNEFVNDAYARLVPYLQKHHPHTFDPYLPRKEKQWILMLSATYVADYCDYVTLNCRPAIESLRIFIRFAIQQCLMGTCKKANGKCESSGDLAYPTYYHVFAEASHRWLSRWDPFGVCAELARVEQEKKRLTTATSSLLKAPAKKAVSE